LIGQEPYLPYNRPPLSKKLWFGEMTINDIFLNTKEYYDQNNVTFLGGKLIHRLDVQNQTITDNSGNEYHFEKLLLSTGGFPRDLSIPGAYLPDIYYYRFLDDYKQLRQEAVEGKEAVVVGGGFIGSEMAAALAKNKVTVTMVFPDKYICSRILPDYFGEAVQQRYIDQGIHIISQDQPLSFAKNGNHFEVHTRNDVYINADILLVGVGIVPETTLAGNAGLSVGNGIIVNEYLQTSHPSIYAAGDNAFTSQQALGRSMRVEHWDNAVHQGMLAGRNMAGAREPYTHISAFFNTFLDLSCESVGEISSSMQTVADWQKKNEVGTIYFLNKGKINGMMMCNIPGKIDEARSIIQRHISPEELLVSKGG
jgi:NAD(P)H-nitrite reductase large subunit